MCAGRLNHLGTQNGRLGAGRGSLRRGAALQRRCSPERVCRAMPRVTGYGNWRKGRRGLECSSPRAWAVGLRSADDRRRARAEAHGRSSRSGRCSGLPSLGSSPIDAPGCCGGGTGSGRLEHHRRQAIARRRAYLRRRILARRGRGMRRRWWFGRGAVGEIGCRGGVRLGRLKRPGGDRGGAQRDKDPGVLALSLIHI